MRIDMENQEKFLEMLQEIREIAAAQQNKMTKEEIARYLGVDSLSEEQMQAVYRYLGESGITVEGYQSVSVVREPLEQEEDMIVSFLRGEDSVRDSLVEMRLAKVAELAKKYEGHGLPREEIIAEGNMGLMVGMRIVERNREEFLLADGSLDREKFFGTLDMEVVHAMENYIDGENAFKDWENAVLAKANLLHEAMKYLAEEMGRVPDVGELSEYTKMEPEEIRRIMDLSRDGK